MTALVPVDQIERMALAVAKSGLFGVKTPDQAMALMLVAQAEGMHPAIAAREIRQSLDFFQTQSAHIETLAHSRAAALLDDHRRIRKAADDRGSYESAPCLPADLIGVYVLLPADL